QRFGPAVLAAIARGRHAPAPQPPMRRHNGEGRPDPAVTARYDRLRAWRARRAAERGVDPDVVLNNDTLLAIARACPADLEALAGLGLLGAWKLEEYGPDLLRAMAEATFNQG
ncbi:MAG: HRDC domain-containing protein, partial [Anaerolineae bacterium]